MVKTDRDQGYPASLTCRHCHTEKYKYRGYLFCGECDGMGYPPAEVLDRD